MRLRVRDVVALVLLAAVVVPYAGCLGYGEIAMIHTARAMASVSPVFGGIAFWVIRGGHRPTAPGRAESGAVALDLLDHGGTRHDVESHR